jgi:hypothetical protein
MAMQAEWQCTQNAHCTAQLSTVTEISLSTSAAAGQTKLDTDVPHLVPLAALPVAEPGPAHDSSYTAQEKQEDSQPIVLINTSWFRLLA